MLVFPAVFSCLAGRRLVVCVLVRVFLRVGILGVVRVLASMRPGGGRALALGSGVGCEGRQGCDQQGADQAKETQRYARAGFGRVGNGIGHRRVLDSGQWISHT